MRLSLLFYTQDIYIIAGKSGIGKSASGINEALKIEGQMFSLKTKINMKNRTSLWRIFGILFYVLLLVVFFCGCEGEKPFYPQYEFAVEYYCPDTLQGKMNDWIKETIRAADQHLSAGNYEDPEGVVGQVKRTAEELFRVRGEGLYVWATENSYREFVPQDKMTESEIKLFARMKAEKNY